jgi:hypothetical protein
MLIGSRFAEQGVKVRLIFSAAKKPYQIDRAQLNLLSKYYNPLKSTPSNIILGVCHARSVNGSFPIAIR